MMQKISPDNFADEVVEGLLLAHPGELRAVGDDHRALVRNDAGTMGRVGIVTGGSLGHLPLPVGYVGDGLTSGAALGDAFAPPHPQQILAATLASDDGAGVLYLHLNNEGDAMAFDSAAHTAADQNIRVAVVSSKDDIDSAPIERRAHRRGAAGLVLVYKTAGAAAARGDDLDAVARLAAKTTDRSATLTIDPSAPTASLVDRLLAELDSTSDVVVLVNRFGGSSLEEAYVLFRRLATSLQERGVRIHRPYVGGYASTPQTSGVSVTLLALDEELRELIDAPARSASLNQGPPPGTATPTPPEHAPALTRRTAQRPASRRPMPAPHPEPPRPSIRFDTIVHGVLARLPGYENELHDLDAKVGDADLGQSVRTGAEGARNALADLPESVFPSDYLRCVATAFAATSSTFMALLGSGMMAAADTLAETDPVGRDDVRDALVSAAERITQRGKAERGDKTMMDVLWCVIEQLDTDDAPAVLARRCAEQSAALTEQQAGLVNQRGRVSWLHERSAGHLDPGSIAMVRIVETIADLMDQ